MHFSILPLCLALVLASEAFCASPDNARGGHPLTGSPAEVPSIAEHQARRDAALTAMRAERAADAENELAALSQIKNRQSPEAQKELATQLLDVAFQARSQGDIPAAQRAATRALRAIEGAERGWAEEPKRLAELQLLRATIMEEFVGTSDDAESHVLEAERLDSENLVAKEKAARVKRGHEAVPAR